MAQLTVYLDDETRKKIESAARNADLSVSRWVKRRLEEALEREWPQGFPELFGSLAGSRLERPDPLPFDRDRPREPL